MDGLRDVRLGTMPPPDSGASEGNCIEYSQPSKRRRSNSMYPQFDAKKCVDPSDPNARERFVTVNWPQVDDDNPENEAIRGKLQSLFRQDTIPITWATKGQDGGNYGWRRTGNFMDASFRTDLDTYHENDPDAACANQVENFMLSGRVGDDRSVPPVNPKKCEEDAHVADYAVRSLKKWANADWQDNNASNLQHDGKDMYYGRDYGGWTWRKKSVVKKTLITFAINAVGTHQSEFAPKIAESWHVIVQDLL